jgi:hypothetical protein
MSRAVAGFRLLQVVADYRRMSAVLGVGRAGHRQASGLQYPGLQRPDPLCNQADGGEAADRTQQQPPAGGSLRGQHPPSRIG